MPHQPPVPPHRNPAHRPGQQRLALHAVAIAAALCLLGMAQPAAAQTGNASANAAAQPGTVITFNLPAQPLGQALTALARQAGAQVLFAAPLTEGKTAPALQGSYSVEQGLDRLLAGSGLVARRSGNAWQVQAVRAATAGEVNTLPAVVVTASPSEITEGTGSYTTGSTSAATGLNLSLRETPQSVTVVTRQRLDDQNLNSLGQVLEQVVGVSAQASSSSSRLAYSSFSSRGYTLNRYQIDGAAASPYAFSFGGGPYGSAGLDTAIYDSVAIVRGPAGLLSGDGNPSGSINLTRKRPTNTFQASLTGSAGRWDQYRATADLGGPLNAAGTLRGRVVAWYDESDSWVSRLQSEKTAAYAVLDADLSDATLLSLALERHHQNDKGSAFFNGLPLAFTGGTPTPFSRSDNAAPDWSRSSLDKTTVSLSLEHRFNDAWRAKLRYGYNDILSQGSFANIGSVTPDGIASISNVIGDRTPSSSHDLDLRLEGSYSLLGRRHDVVAGFNGYRGRHSYNRFNGALSTEESVWGWSGKFPEPHPSLLNPTHFATENQQYGLFLSTRLRPADDLSVILGGRLSNWENNTVNRVTGATTDDRKESSVFVPYAGVVYDLSKSLSAYASYTEIFNPQSSQDVSGNVLDPEEGKNYELGLKGEWFGGSLNASAAMFETRKDNLAVRDGDNLTPSGGYAYYGASGTKGRGWELEVAGELAPGWQVQGGYARIVTRDAEGGLLNSAYVPKHSVKLFTIWKPAAVNGLTVGGGVNWQSEINESSSASYYSAAQLALFRQKSYAVVNLLAQYRFNDHWHLSVNLNNVFDKSYRTSTTRHEYGAPRNLRATLRYQF